MPYININDAYILDNTGKQVDDAVDYALANSNRNLLDNPWLTIRQRGNGPFTGAVYTADRWKGYGGTTATLTTNGVTLTQASGNHINFHQYITDELLNSILGKTVTASIMDANGTVYSATNTLPSTMASGASTAIGRLNIGDGLNAYIGNRTSGRPNGAFFSIYGIPSTVQTVNIRAFKLELGSYSTLANDVPPDYAEELTKCRYYFRRISNTSGYTQLWLLGRNRSTTGADFHGALGNQPMRTAPTISRSGSIYVQNSDTNIAITDLTRYFTVSSDLVFRATVSSGLTANALSALAIGSGAYIDLSADL